MAGRFGNFSLVNGLCLAIPNLAPSTPRSPPAFLAPHLPPLLAAATVLLLAALAEWWHARKVARLARLAFGPAAAARAWTKAVPFLRVLALAAFTWGLAVMYQLHLAAGKDGRPEPKESPRLIFIADLSPSMLLKDAGPEGKQTRRERMREEVESILMRVGGDLRYGVVSPSVKITRRTERSGMGATNWMAEVTAVPRSVVPDFIT